MCVVQMRLLPQEVFKWLVVVYLLGSCTLGSVRTHEELETLADRVCTVGWVPPDAQECANATHGLTPVSCSYWRCTRQGWESCYGARFPHVRAQRCTLFGSTAGRRCGELLDRILTPAYKEWIVLHGEVVSGTELRLPECVSPWTRTLRYLPAPLELLARSVLKLHKVMFGRSDVWLQQVEKKDKEAARYIRNWTCIPIARDWYAWIPTVDATTRDPLLLGTLTFERFGYCPWFT